MTQNTVVVIDGSNIATEGRSLPSLAQLDEAVRSFLEEYPHDQFIVVVDATFEHRIDPSERQMYDEALAANELLTPPAGTIGRGDAFILAIAEKANATVFSNDSFQEFHGDFDWLFEEGRLIGGKPVPFIGWVFTARTPVRGQKSRQATRSSARKRVRAGETASAKSATRATPRRSATSPAANLPMPVPTVPPPGPVRSRRGEGRVEAPAADASDQQRARPRDQDGGDGVERAGRRGGRKRSAAPSLEPVNEGLAFVTFISEHAVGETVEGVVTEFSSHGAYVTVGDARCYVPLAYLGDPPPRAAREVLERGAAHTFVVQAIDGPRRAIDLALPGFERLDGVTDRAEGIDEDDEAPAARRSRLAAADETVDTPASARSAPAPAPVDALVAEVAGELAGEPLVRRRTRKGPARARAAQAASPLDEPEVAADRPAVSDDEPELDDRPAPRRRTRKAAPPVPVAEAVAPVPDVEQEAPRRRTRKAATPAGEPATAPDPLAPDAGAAGAEGGAADRPVRRGRPRKAAEQVDEGVEAPVVEPAGDQLVTADGLAAVPDPLAPETGAAEVDGTDRPVRRARPRKAAGRQPQPAAKQPAQPVEVEAGDQPVAAALPDPLAPETGAAEVDVAGRPVRRARPRKAAAQQPQPAAEQPDEGFGAPAGDQPVAAGAPPPVPDPLAPGTGAAEVDGPARPVRRARPRKAAAQPTQPAAEQAARPAAEQPAQPAGEQVAGPAAEQPVRPAAEQAVPAGAPPRGRGRRVAVPDPAAPAAEAPDADGPVADAVPAPRPAKRAARKATPRKAAASADPAAPAPAPATPVTAEPVPAGSRPGKVAAAPGPVAADPATPAPAKRAPAKRTAKKAAPTADQDGGAVAPAAKATRRRSPRSSPPDA